VQFRKVAEARRDRAEFGTRGWRVIAVDEYGEWMVGEREADWAAVAERTSLSLSGKICRRGNVGPLNAMMDNL
jgi:hypothetical protein